MSPEAEASDDAKDRYFADLRRQKEGYADAWLKFYGRHIILPHIFYRIAGTLVIVGSVSLPYLAQTTSEANRTALSLVSLGVALLTALLSFFGWHHTWQRRMTVNVALKHYIACWEIDMLRAYREDYDRAKVDAYLATSQLFTMVFTTVGAESQTFFATLKPPHDEGEAGGQDPAAGLVPG